MINRRFSPPAPVTQLTREVNDKCNIGLFDENDSQSLRRMSQRYASIANDLARGKLRLHGTSHTPEWYDHQARLYEAAANRQDGLTLAEATFRREQRRKNPNHAYNPYYSLFRDSTEWFRQLFKPGC